MGPRSQFCGSTSRGSCMSWQPWYKYMPVLKSPASSQPFLKSHHTQNSHLQQGISEMMYNAGIIQEHEEMHR